MNSKLMFVASTAILLSALAFAPANAVLIVCGGGTQEAVATQSQNASTSTLSAVFVEIPGTGITGGSSGGAGDADTYTVTFSGESSATGGGRWEAQAQVSIDGGAFVNLDPNGPNTFQQGNLGETHTMTWCRRLVAVSSTRFRIVWRKIGGGSAVVDDFLMRVERSN